MNNTTDEPPVADASSGGLMTAQRQAWELDESFRRQDARNQADPVWRARQRLPEEMARLEAAEIEVQRLERALDRVVADQYAGAFVPITDNEIPIAQSGYATSLGAMIQPTQEHTEARQALEAAIDRRGRIAAEVSAAQTRRFHAALEARR